MSKKKSVSLDCSKVPHHAISTQKDGSNTPNTPEILNTIINISSEHLDNFKKTIQENSFPNTIKYENTKSNELFLEKQAFDLSSSSCNFNINKDKVDVHPQVKHFHSQIIKEGLKFKVKQKLKEEPGRRKSWISSEEDFKYGEVNSWLIYILIIFSLAINRSRDSRSHNVCLFLCLSQKIIRLIH